MTFEDTARRLLEGHAVTSIGQLSAATRGWLGRAVKRGLLLSDWDCSYPEPKERYRARGDKRADLRKLFHASRINEESVRCPSTV